LKALTKIIKERPSVERRKKGEKKRVSRRSGETP
jgi:hypothetical protein